MVGIQVIRGWRYRQVGDRWKNNQVGSLELGERQRANRQEDRRQESRQVGRRAGEKIESSLGAIEGVQE